MVVSCVLDGDRLQRQADGLMISGSNISISGTYVMPVQTPEELQEIDEC
jgi:hypothetical protein